MTASAQKYLAIAGVAVALGVFAAGTAQLFVAAFGSQPDCVAVESDAVPSKRSC